jgi:hypothetical protein
MADIKIRKTSAPELKPFGNAVTRGILISIIALVAVGSVLTLAGSFMGVIVGSVGILAWWAGYTKIPTDPRTGGALTCWGSFVELNGKSIVVGGDTILADYFPFYLGYVPFELTNRDKDFPMTVMSKDNVPLEGVVSITLRPEIEDAVDYIQAGKMDNILLQLDDIIYEIAKRHGRMHNGEEIAKDSELISGPIRAHLGSDEFGESNFGVTVIKVQAKFDMPEDVLIDMKQQVREQYQRKNELLEYETDIMAAKKLQEQYSSDPHMTGKVPTLKECLQEIKTLRLIRDQRVARIESTGNTGNVILADANLDMGRKGKGKDN